MKSYTSVSEVSEFEDVVHVARFYKPDGTLYVFGDFASAGSSALVTSILDDEETSVHSSTGAVSVSDPVYALVNDGYWTKDSVGYNFRNTISMSALSGGSRFQGGRTYKTVYKLVSDSNGTVILVFIDRVRAVLSV